MTWKVLLSIFFIVAMISGVAYALDFDNVKNMIYRGKYVDFQAFEPFDGNGFPTSSPTWFSLENLQIKKSVVNGLLVQKSDGTFKNKISVMMNGNLIVDGKSKAVQIRFWSDPSSETNCPIFTDQKILCEANGSHIRIYRQGYRWTGNVDKYTMEIEDKGVGFKNITITGYYGDNQVFKFVIVEQWFKFSYFSAPRKVLTFAAQGGIIEYINPPADANPSLPFDMSNYSDIRNSSSGKIVYNGGFAGSMQLVFLGAYKSENPRNPVMDKQILRFDTSAYLVEVSFSDCPIFNSTDVFCKIRSGYQHAYRPAHEDITLWKTRFNLMLLNITNGKMSISAGINNGTDFFKITGMDVTKLEIK